MATAIPPVPTPIAPTAPVIRPGISSSTLTSYNIRWITADVAADLVGLRASGIYIPFHGVKVNDRPYGRLRLDIPMGDMKYYQATNSGEHIYVIPDFGLYDGVLIMVEGEFKALSLCEAGFPTIGTSGFYSWRYRPDKQDKKSETFLSEEFAAVITKHKPTRIVFIGDADTAVNYMFADAAVSLQALTKLPVSLFRIPYASTHGKGIDDIRHSMGPDAFKDWFLGRFHSAIRVPDQTVSFDFHLQLIDYHSADFVDLSPQQKKESAEKIAKTNYLCGESKILKLAKLAKKHFGYDEPDFIAFVNAKRTEEGKKRKNKSGTPNQVLAMIRCPGSGPNQVNHFSSSGGGPNGDGPPSAAAEAGLAFDPTVFNRFMVVGKNYYSTSTNPTDGKDSEVLSICEANHVTRSLRAAGYRGRNYPGPIDPIFALYPGNAPLDVAMLFLHDTRCTNIVNRLFRPYGRLIEADGTCVYNNSRVKPMEPTSFGPLLNEENLLYHWLVKLLKDTQLYHFISILSYLYIAARKQEPKKSQAIFLVGPPSSGKSFLIDYVLPRIFGQKTAADATRLFRGENGASAVLSSFILKMSDRDVSDEVGRRRIQGGLLGLLADHTTDGKLMHQNVTTEEVYNLFCFSSNEDGMTASILKDLSPTVLSKMSIYKCHGGFEDVDWSRFPAGAVENKVQLIEADLPAFCWMLEHWYSIYPTAAAVYEPRYGVPSFAAQDVFDAIPLNDEERLVYECLLNVDATKVTAKEVIQRINATNPGVRLFQGTEYRLGRILRLIGERYPDLVVVRQYMKSCYYDILGSSHSHLKARAEVGEVPTTDTRRGVTLPYEGV